MIITDPSKAPRERLAEIVKGYFLGDGFTYKKSFLEFSKAEKNRTIIVRLFFFKTINLVKGSLSWGIVFPQLEKAWKKIALHDQRKGYTVTLWTDLLNYQPLRKTNIPISIKMFNEETFKYDDISLNSAGDWIITNYENYIAPYFEFYSTLSNLEKEMNELPLNHHSELSYGGRQIAFGLILRKKFIPENFVELANQYQQHILNGEEDEDFKRTMLIYLERTRDFLKDNDINKLLPG